MDTIGTAHNITAATPDIIFNNGIPQVRIPYTKLVAVVEDLDNKEYVLKKIHTLARTTMNIGTLEDKARLRQGMLPYLNEEEMSEWLGTSGLVEYQMLYYKAYVTGTRVQYQLSIMVDIAKALRANVLEVRNALLS